MKCVRGLSATFTLAAATVGFAASAVGGSHADLQGLLADASKQSRWFPSSYQQVLESRDLFQQTLGALMNGGDTNTRLDALGWRIERINQRLQVLRESPGQKRGRGLFVIGPLPGDRLLIQAPHQFTDLDTGRILASVVAESPSAAAAFNTVPRQITVAEREVDSDLAHLGYSEFMAFTDAFVRAVPDARVVQLHGFDQAKRTTPEGRDADVILSNGTQTPGPYVSTLANCLRRTWPKRVVRLYPVEVDELGARTNTIGKLVRSAHGDRFVHVELSRPLRRQMARDADLRRDLMRCLRGEDRSG